MLKLTYLLADGVEQSTNVIFSVIMYSTNEIKGLANAHIKIVVHLRMSGFTSTSVPSDLSLLLSIPMKVYIDMSVFVIFPDYFII